MPGLTELTRIDYATRFHWGTAGIAPDGARTGQVTEEQPATLLDWFSGTARSD